MKLLRIISSMHPSKGGPCQGIRNAVPYFEKLGISNEVVCMDEQNDIYPISDDFVIYKIGSGKTSYQYHPQLLKWLKNNILNYDFVIVHGLWQYYNWAVYKTIKLLKKRNQKVPKVIIMPHGMLDPYFQKATDRKWKALRNEIVWSLIEKKCINNADAIFYTCEEEMRLAATTFKSYRPKKEFNVGYGIQMPPENDISFSNDFYKICPKVVNKKYLLFLSRIHEKKGVDLLIMAYDELFRKNQDLPDLVIAGPIESDYSKRMIEMASKNIKIHFPGMLTGNAKWGAFYNCEAYLLPSHQENFGIAIVEAMACKKPVLITKNVNIWREIFNGSGGWVVDLNKKNDLRENLHKISCLTKEQLINMGKSAYKTYIDHFDTKQFSQKSVEVLRKL